MSHVPPSHDTAKVQIPIVMVNCPCKYNSEFIHTQKELLPRFQGAGPVLATANNASDLWEKSISWNVLNLASLKSLCKLMTDRGNHIRKLQWWKSCYTEDSVTTGPLLLSWEPLKCVKLSLKDVLSPRYWKGWEP